MKGLWKKVVFFLGRGGGGGKKNLGKQKFPEGEIMLAL